MTYKDIYNQVNPELQKKAWDIAGTAGNVSYLALALAALAAAGISGGAGYAAAKVSAPGQQDLENVTKQHRLARIKHDNETQKISQQRQENQRNAGRPVKSMRIG